MDGAENPYINLERKLLLVLGAWPFQEPRETRLRTSVVCMITITLAGVTILGYVKKCCSFEIIAEMIPLVAMAVAFTGKYATTYYGAKKLRRLYKQMERDWSLLLSAEERAVAGEVAENGRQYNLNFAKLMYFMACGYCILPFSSLILDIIIPLNESRPLRHMYRIEYCIDPQKYYYPIYLHLILGTVTIITGVVATDSMYLSKMHHARGLFRLAGYQLRSAFNERATYNCIDVKRMQLLKRLFSGIDSHRRAMKFCANVYDLYQMPHILLAIAGFVAITVSMFCAAAFLGQFQEMVTYTIFFIGQILYAFVVMYPVQQMSDESAQIFYEIYSAQWYGAPLTSQKIVVTIMQKTMIPTKVVFAKLFTVSLETLSIVVQTAISYCTVLCSIR